MKHLFLYIGMIVGFCTSSIDAQVLDEEIGFIYVKAEYLYETGRYDEAVVQYNAVITKDVNYKSALVKRGFAKFHLAAYKGAKMDAIQSIDNKGITAESAALLGKSLYSLGDKEGAIHSLTAAIALDDKNADYYEWRGDIYEDTNKKLSACADYEKAMNLGSYTGETKSRQICGKSKPVQVKVPPTETNRNEPQSSNGGENNTAGGDENKTMEHQQDHGANTEQSNNTQADSMMVDDSEPMLDDPNIPKSDDFTNSFVIDEDLSIEIYGQELGRRTLSEIPSILILADENGKVSVDICVNRSGIVTKAEFNASLSSIAKKSLVSLALRKAKEFEFAEGKYDMQCGIMVFNIKGS